MATSALADIYDADLYVAQAPLALRSNFNNALKHFPVALHRA
jgi:hypothetical protein